MEIALKLPMWFSGKDEDYFFAWLESIDQVENFVGGARGLVVTIREPIDNRGIQDLAALMMRYNLDMKWMRNFRTKENEKWFCSEEAYWHQAVFRD